jgi:hypothetical protein
MAEVTKKIGGIQGEFDQITASRMQEVEQAIQEWLKGEMEDKVRVDEV